MAEGSLVTKLTADLRPLEKGLDRALQKLRQFHQESQRLGTVGVGAGGATVLGGRLPTIGGRPTDPVRAGADEFRARQANVMQQVRLSQFLAADDRSRSAEKRRRDDGDLAAAIRGVKQLEAEEKQINARRKADEASFDRFVKQKRKEREAERRDEARVTVANEVDRIRKSQQAERQALAERRAEAKATVANEVDRIRKGQQADRERQQQQRQILTEGSRTARAQMTLEQRARREAEREVSTLFRPTERITGARTLGESARAAGQRAPGGGPGGRGDLLDPSRINVATLAARGLRSVFHSIGGITQAIGLSIGVGMVGAVGGVIAAGFKLNKDFDRFRITMAASLALTHDVVDAQGNLVTGQARVNALLAEAPQRFQVIRKIAKDTLLEQNELIETITQNLAFAERAGFKTATPEQFERTARTIATISQLARATGLPGGQRQLAQETRALFLGERLQGAQIAQLLGFRSAAEIQRLQQQQSKTGAANAFVDELEKRLKDVDPILRRFRDSFEGVTTTLISEFKEFLRLATLPAFKEVTSFFQTLRDQLGDDAIERGAKGIGEGLRGITQSVIAIARVTPGFIKFLDRIGGVSARVGVLGAVSRAAGALSAGDVRGAFEAPFATGPTQALGEKLTDRGDIEAQARERAIATRVRAQTLREFAQVLRAPGRDVERLRRGRTIPSGISVEQFEARAVELDKEAALEQKRARKLAGIRLVSKQLALTDEQKQERLAAQVALAQAQQQQRAVLVLEANARALQIRETVKDELARHVQLRAVRLNLKRSLEELEEDQAQSLRESRAKAAADELAELKAKHARELTELRRRFVNDPTLPEREALLGQQQGREGRGLFLERQQRALGFQGQAAGARGQTLRGINLQAQQEVNTVRQAINARKIEEQSGLRLIQAIRDEAERKRIQTIRQSNDQAVDLVQQFNSLVRRQVEQRRSFEEGLLALEERVADRRRQLVRARVKNERDLTDTLRGQTREREDLALGREERAIRTGLARELGRSLIYSEQFPALIGPRGEPIGPYLPPEQQFQTFREPSLQERVQQRFERRTERELPGLGTGEVRDLAKQRTQEFLRSLIDTLLGPEGLQQALAQLREVGIAGGGGLQRQLAGLVIRAGEVRGGRARLEEARAGEDIGRPLEEATRRVADTRRDREDLEREEGRARRQDFLDRRALDEGLRISIRETSLEFVRLAAATREFLDTLRRAGIAVPAGTRGALTRPLGGEAGRIAAEAGVAGAIQAGRTTPTTGLMGPPIPRPRPGGGPSVFGPGVAGQFIPSIPTLAQRGGGGATGIVEGAPGGVVTGSGIRIAPEATAGAATRATSGSGGGGTVTIVNFNLAGMSVGADTRAVLEELAKKLERDARRTPAP